MKIKYLQLQYGDNKKKREKKKHPVLRILLILFVIGIILFGAAFGIIGKKYGYKRTLDKGLVVLTDILNPVLYKTTIFFNERKGITDIYYGLNKDSISTLNYIDNNLTDTTIDLNNLPQDTDTKLLMKSSNIDRLVNYPSGYYIDLPKDLEYDFSLSKDFISANSNNLYLNISIDESPYFDMFEYINHYQNRFYLDETYQKENNIVINENRYDEFNGRKALILSLTRNTDNTETLNTYTYAYMKLYSRTYLRIMFKTNEFNDNYINTYTQILNSFTQIKKQGVAKYNIDFFPTANSNWNEKTSNLYNHYSNTNDIDFGIFAKDVTTTGINETIPNIEQKIENNFDIVLMYNHLGEELNIEGINTMVAKNKTIEFTLQTCHANNERLFGYTPMFDIIDGKKDDQIINLANQLKQLDTQILFRLNNEMNSDWTSYSGIITLSDPELYIAVWQRIYNIFEQQGVNNCIWIYNPNDNNFPPCPWNNYLAYYPGNDYVDMIGVTGYNTGTYYFASRGEIWREFETIYDEINEKYQPIFNKFPWIITEFATSSVGGDKPGWITNMFNAIDKYPNIKAMVWFSFADYDPDVPGNTQVSRPYWLDETPESLEAFKNGLNKFRNK